MRCYKEKSYEKRHPLRKTWHVPYTVLDVYAASFSPGMQQVIVEVGNKSQQDSEQNPEVNESLLFQRTLSNNMHPLLLPQHVSASECAPVVLHLNKGHIGR